MNSNVLSLNSLTDSFLHWLLSPAEPFYWVFQLNYILQFSHFSLYYLILTLFVDGSSVPCIFVTIILNSQINHLAPFH